MKNLFIFSLLIIVFTACYEDHSEVIPGQDFIPDDILTKIQDNGQVLYEGLNPPELEGKFVMSPYVLRSSNIPDDFDAGTEFGRKTIEFTDFDPESLRLAVTLEQGGSVGEGYESFIAGTGDNFTVYVRVERTDENGNKRLLTEVYSGRLTGSGIFDMTSSIFMIDDFGDPEDNVIEIGQGRLFADQDGFSERL